MKVEVPVVLLEKYEKEAKKIAERTGGVIEIVPLSVYHRNNIRYVELYVSGKFNCSGWRFVAQIIKNKDRNLIKAIRDDVEIDPEWHNIDILRRCDHCHMNRERVTSYIIENEETGKRMVIGSACVKPFFNNLTPDKLARYFTKFFKLCEEIRNANEYFEKNRYRAYKPLKEYVKEFAEKYLCHFSRFIDKEKLPDIEQLHEMFGKYIHLDLESYLNTMTPNHDRMMLSNLRTIYDEGVLRLDDRNIRKNVNHFLWSFFSVYEALVKKHHSSSYFHDKERILDIAEKIGMPKDLVEEYRKYVHEINNNNTNNSANNNINNNIDKNLVEFMNKHGIAAIKNESLGKKGDSLEVHAIHVRTFYPNHSDTNWKRGYEFITDTGHRIVIFCPREYVWYKGRKIRSDTNYRNSIPVVENNPRSVFRINAKVLSSSEYKNNIKTIIDSKTLIIEKAE